MNKHKTQFKSILVKKREARRANRNRPMSRKPRNRFMSEGSFANFQIEPNGNGRKKPSLKVRGQCEIKKKSLKFLSKSKSLLKTPLRKESKSFIIEDDKTSTRAETPRSENEEPLNSMKRHFMIKVRDEVIREDPGFWLLGNSSENSNEKYYNLPLSMNEPMAINLALPNFK